MILILCHESIVGILANTKACRGLILAFTLSHPALSFFELDPIPPAESSCTVSAFCLNKDLKVAFVYMYPIQLVSVKGLNIRKTAYSISKHILSKYTLACS
jgi:hypothetical protein